MEVVLDGINELKHKLKSQKYQSKSKNQYIKEIVLIGSVYDG